MTALDVTATAPGLWDAIVANAAAESALWAESALPPAAQQREAVFSTLAEPVFALGLETIYEGYLAHHGRPRLFAPPDADTALLLGDYLYAHGLVHVAGVGRLEAVRDLAELISLCSQIRADRADGDAEAWAATAALLGSGALDGCRAALRERGDAGPLGQASRDAAGDAAVDAALAAHAVLVG